MCMEPIDLSAILPHLRRTPAFERVRALSAGRILTLGVGDAAKPAALAAIAGQREGPVVVITTRADRAEALAEELSVWLGADAEVLLQAGLKHALCVDMSQAALAASAEEAQRQGMAGRIEWMEGDFVAVAATVPSADLVALDRVVCCYPAYAPLLEHAAAHGRRLLALSYPRDRWWVRVGVWIENTWRRLNGEEFRAFVHPPAAMAALLAKHGFTRARAAATWTWQVEVYARNAT